MTEADIRLCKRRFQKGKGTKLRANAKNKEQGEETGGERSSQPPLLCFNIPGAFLRLLIRSLHLEKEGNWLLRRLRHIHGYILAA